MGPLLGWGRCWDDYYSEDEDSVPEASSADESEPPIDEDAECMPDDPSSPVAVIAELLADAPKALGEFTFGGRASTLPPVPGLFVDGVGPVPVPLVANSTTHALISASEQAPFGTMTDTRVDVNVRRTFQISPNKVHFGNPAWKRGLLALKDEIAARLGFENMPLELHLYKMLIYEKGGHFIRHRDTEKDDRMFATLVIQLPSLHQGGNLVVYHNGPQGEQETVHDFGGAASPFEPHYAVHYADAEHAVTPITDGYRLALHEYTPKSITELGIAAFKGTDRDRASTLVAANNTIKHQPNRFAFYLARAERVHSYYGTVYDDYELIYEAASISITGWFTIDGLELRRNPYGSYDLDNADCNLNPDEKTLPALWRGHRSSTYEGYLGNEGPTKDTTYFKWVLVAFPMSEKDRKRLTLARFASEEDRLASFIALNPSSSDGLIAWLQELVADRHATWSSISREYSKAFTSKLIALILSKSFAEAIPTLFETISTILVWEMVPQLVGFLRSPFWEFACEPLINHLRNAGSRFELGLYLIHSAHTNQVAAGVWGKLLPVVLSALPPTIGEQQQLQITQLLRAPLWEHARRPLLDALATDQNKFADYLQVFSMAVNARVTTDAAMSILPIALKAIPSNLSSQKVSNMTLFMFAPYWQHAQGPLLAALSTTPARLRVGLDLIQSARNRSIPDETWQPLLPIALSGFPTVLKADHIKHILILMHPLLWPSARDQVLQGLKRISRDPQSEHHHRSSTVPTNVGRSEYVLNLIEKAIAQGTPGDIWQPLVPLAASSIRQPVSNKHLPQLVSLMNPKLWPFACNHVVNALSKLPVQTSSSSPPYKTNPRFEVTLGLVDKAREADIPVEVWQQFLSIVISGINASNIQKVASAEYQPQFWGAVFAASDEVIIDLASPRFNHMRTHFLRGPHESLLVRGEFSGIADARNFVSRYGNRDQLKYGYSVSMTASGVGRNASVTITKTSAYFDVFRKQARKYSQEYSKLKGMLPKVPRSQTDPAPAPTPTQTGADHLQQSDCVPSSTHPAATTGQKSKTAAFTNQHRDGSLAEARTWSIGAGFRK
ncbi:hypothetical protein HK102_010414 [Quaeritorhiza haematococci]|nr:hypothetical protein HK102_010414 [Quaeritorhiza haematococci]